jgi:hypothetical protein
VNDLPPDLQLQRLANAYQLSRAVQVAARLGIGRLLADGPRTAPDLARATATDDRVLTQLLRLLVDLKVVEALPGMPEETFGPTPLSDRLHRVDNIAQGEEAWATWGALPEALRTGRPSFPQVHGQSFYEYTASHPQQAAHWQETNTKIAAGLSPAVAAELTQGRFLKDGETVIDVGGGQGVLLAAILERHPGCRGLLFDLPEAVEGAEEILTAAGVAERCKVVAGDAFEGVPPGGAIYLLSRVLFNWGDESAVQLLTRCRERLAERRAASGATSGQVLVIEVLRQSGQGGLAAADLHHFLLWGGSYRTRQDFETLFERAGLRLTEVRGIGAGESGWQILEGRDKRS